MLVPPWRPCCQTVHATAIAPGPATCEKRIRKTSRASEGKKPSVVGARIGRRNRVAKAEAKKKNSKHDCNPAAKMPIPGRSGYMRLWGVVLIDKVRLAASKVQSKCLAPTKNDVSPLDLYIRVAGSFWPAHCSACLLLHGRTWAGAVSRYSALTLFFPTRQTALPRLADLTDPSPAPNPLTRPPPPPSPFYRRSTASDCAPVPAPSCRAYLTKYRPLCLPT